VPANDVFASERRKQETRQALWRWLVAGLCMMQVMMYAYPAYVAQPGDLTGEMEQLLRWASWVLTLPVMLFSCGPFFRNALRDITQGSISMDLPVALGMLITFAISTAGTFEPNGTFGREVYFDLTMFVVFFCRRAVAGVASAGPHSGRPGGVDEPVARQCGAPTKRWPV
jgi:Cu2+-exporting ATPase